MDNWKNERYAQWQFKQINESIRLIAYDLDSIITRPLKLLKWDNNSTAIPKINPSNNNLVFFFSFLFLFCFFHSSNTPEIANDYEHQARHVLANRMRCAYQIYTQKCKHRLAAS